jgi:hypothetical protein
VAENRQNPPRIPRVSLRRQRGNAIEVGGCAVSAESLILTLRLPSGVFVWQRPSAVVVEQDGRTNRLPIRDATRLVQCALIGGVVILGLVARRRAGGSKEELP